MPDYSIGKVPTVFTRVSILIVALSILCGTLLTFLLAPDEAQAIPAFARKYNTNCMDCHTAPPMLNAFGQRFLENGYQLPGTEDGGSTGKKKLGDLNLDDVNQYVGFRLVGNAVSSWGFKKQNPASSGIVENKTEFTFPENFVLFAGGTVAKNVGFMVELGHDVQAGGAEVERGFVTFNNLGSHNLAHLRVGKFDPNTFSSYATVRQQLGDVEESQKGGCAAPAPCGFNRVGLSPSAFATKFYGLYDRSGNGLSPFASSLYNSGHETGVDVHGRPFGDWFLYQVGVLNGANESLGDSNKGKDVYGMVRFDYAQSNFFSASMSGFVYQGNSNAKVQTREDVNWNRYGLSARATYMMVDVYAAYSVDKINKTPTGVAGLFDSTATGLTVGADAYVTSQTLVSLRYDNLDAGGMLAQRTSASFVGVQAKHFLRANVAIFARSDFNLRQSEGGDIAARNLRNAFFSGIDVIF
ncbi:MAG: hypothetical protein CAF43_011995 [Nitrospira sp. CG24C]|jgi:hypothetical protein|nr:MAG: hypothetical protein CAF43_011995 [Nitrospira sp. CG24C]TKB54428.1 MAG: hypothetical protein E8D50_04515 [Nitrospira sp.]